MHHILLGQISSARYLFWFQHMHLDMQVYSAFVYMFVTTAIHIYSLLDSDCTDFWIQHNEQLDHSLAFISFWVVTRSDLRLTRWQCSSTETGQKTHDRSFVWHTIEHEALNAYC